MGAVYFYHLTQQPLEMALPVLLEKARGAGWKIGVRTIEESRVDWLDQRLWLGREDGFLPHGMAGREHENIQPILISVGDEFANDPECLMAVDGAEVTQREVDAMDRTCILFDGNDPDALARARTQWKSLTDAGCEAQYWAQDGGRWVKKAESGG